MHFRVACWRWSSHWLVIGGLLWLSLTNTCYVCKFLTIILLTWSVLHIDLVPLALRLPLCLWMILIIFKARHLRDFRPTHGIDSLIDVVTSVSHTTLSILSIFIGTWWLLLWLRLRYRFWLLEPIRSFHSSLLSTRRSQGEIIRWRSYQRSSSLVIR